MDSVLGINLNRFNIKFAFCIIGTLSFFLVNCKLEQDADLLFALPLASASSNPEADQASNPCGLNFTSFSFAQSANSLTKDYTGTIGTNTVTVSLPYGRIVRAIANFETTENTTAQISSVTQVSGTTSQNYSSPVSYTLSRANCSDATITVNVTSVAPVPDTGQGVCFDSGNVAACTSGAVVTDHPRQDGIVSSANGRSLLATVSTSFSDRITVDRVTGLIWNSCLIGQDQTNNCSGGGTAVNQDNAVTSCADLNDRNAGAGYAGLKFWRLPTIQELQYITYHNDGEPFIHATRFPNIVTGNSVWSITENINNATEGFRLRYVNGNFLNIRTDSGGRFALCVSGGSPPSRSWNTINDEEVEDLRAGLIWKRCTTGRTYPGCTGADPNPNWQAALQACAGLGTRWRLPNSHELISLYDYSNATNGMNATLFPNVGNGNQYWSATTSAEGGSENMALAMNSNGELTTTVSKSTNSNIKAYCVQDSN